MLLPFSLSLSLRRSRSGSRTVAPSGKSKILAWMSIVPHCRRPRVVPLDRVPMPAVCSTRMLCPIHPMDPISILWLRIIWVIRIHKIARCNSVCCNSSRSERRPEVAGRSCHREGVDAAAPEDKETARKCTKTWTNFLRIVEEHQMKFCWHFVKLESLQIQTRWRRFFIWNASKELLLSGTLCHKK